MRKISMHTFLDSWLGKNWWAALVSIDLFLLVFTITNPYLSNFQQKWRFITPFSLHTENNFAAWWSGITMLLAALLAFQRALSGSSNNRFAWMILSIVLAGLSLDEIGSFHERIGHTKGWHGIFPFGILLLCLLAYVNLNLFRSEQTIINAKYLCIAITLFFSVAIQEYVEHNYTWKPWMLGIRVGIEEGTELLATLFVLAAVIYKKKQRLTTLSLIPKPQSISKLRWIAAIGLITHILGSYLIVKLGDPFFRGNPMNWYPTSIYFCIALGCFYKVIRPSNPTEGEKWGLLATLTIITSIAITTNLFSIILPNTSKIIDPTIISDYFLLIYIIQLLTFTVLLTKSFHITPAITMASIIFISALIFLDLNLENTWLRYTMLGTLSYWTFHIFTSKNLLGEEA